MAADNSYRMVANRFWLRAGAAVALDDFLVADAERGDLPFEAQGVGALEPVSDERRITTEVASVVEEMLALPGSGRAAALELQARMCCSAQSPLRPAGVPECG